MSQTIDITAKPDILKTVKDFLGNITKSATNASLDAFRDRVKAFIKAYWWVLLPLPVMVIYWAYKFFTKNRKKGKR